MKFSMTVQTKIGDYQIAKEAEDLGYDAVWFPDTQMLWSDCYATMALAARATSRIRLGTGVAIPGTRLAPVTAHSIASINQIAPGRVFLGIGTGHTAMRVMGQNPMPLKRFAEYLRVVRALLRGQEVDFTYEGRTRKIQFLHPDMGFRNVSDPVPIYVAANGPKALEVAGRYGEGLVSAMNEQPDVLAFNLGMVKQGASAAGRELGPDFHTTALTNAVVLRAGETLTDERIVEATGAWVTCLIHFVYEIYEYTHNEEMIPEFMHGIWEEYRNHVDQMETPPEKRFREIHDGHCTYHVASERRFITPEMIRGTHLVGSADEIAEQVRKAEAGGLDEISLLPPIAALRETMRDFTQVMERL